MGLAIRGGFGGRGLSLFRCDHNRRSRSRFPFSPGCNFWPLNDHAIAFCADQFVMPNSESRRFGLAIWAPHSHGNGWGSRKCFMRQRASPTNRQVLSMSNRQTLSTTKIFSQPHCGIQLFCEPAWFASGDLSKFLNDLKLPRDVGSRRLLYSVLVVLDVDGRFGRGAKPIPNCFSGRSVRKAIVVFVSAFA